VVGDPEFAQDSASERAGKQLAALQLKRGSCSTRSTSMASRGICERRAANWRFALASKGRSKVVEQMKNS
jgi:hypothetical protein